VKLDGFAVTPEGSPVMATEMEPVKPLSAEVVTVIAVLVAPALRASEFGETAREKSGVAFGGELAQDVRRQAAPR
jgi:hypothetical protein